MNPIKNILINKFPQLICPSQIPIDNDVLHQMEFPKGKSSRPCWWFLFLLMLLLIIVMLMLIFLLLLMVMMIVIMLIFLMPCAKVYAYVVPPVPSWKVYRYDDTHNCLSFYHSLFIDSLRLEIFLGVSPSASNPVTQWYIDCNWQIGLSSFR